MKRTRMMVAGAVIAAGAAVPAVAMAGGDSNQPIAGNDLERASAVALEHLGEGRVTGSEIGDEESYYEIEVTLDDGSRVDVQLTAEFVVVGTKNDGSGTEDASEN